MEPTARKYFALGLGTYAFVVTAVAPLAVDPLGVWIARPVHRGAGEVVFRGLELVTASLLATWGAGRLRSSESKAGSSLRSSESKAGSSLLSSESKASWASWARGLLTALLAAGAAIAAVDTVAFYRALLAGGVASIAIVPASAFAAAALGVLADGVRRESDAPVRWSARSKTIAAASIAGALVIVPLGELATFGVSRYERSASVAVVFGARAYRNGAPSEALADRVDEAARLYKKGLVKKLFLSGGVDPHVFVSEAGVMRARAEADGVPAEAIEIDELGNDTRATVENATRSMRAHGDRSALVVTHWFHEPRAKLLFDAAGVRTFTVPARMRRRLLGEPWFVAREVAAHYIALARTTSRT